MSVQLRKILFIIIDQLRADCVRGALADAIAIPNLRALMAESVTFAQHYTVTVPCGPARASLLTGLYAMNHRSVRNGAPLDATLDTLPKALRQAGVEPLLFGYTDTSADPRRLAPDDPALKTYEGVMPGFTPTLVMAGDACYPWLAALKTKGYRLPAEHPDLYRPIASEPGRPAVITDPALYRAEDSDTAFLTDQAIAALSVRQEMPWVAQVNYVRPHPPFVAPAPYNRMVVPDTLPLPSAAAAEHERAVHPLIDTAFAKAKGTDLSIGFDLSWSSLSLQQTQDLLAVYLGLVMEVDVQIGRLLEGLDATDQLDETLIVVTSDHGEMLGDHRMWGKACFYD